MRTTESARARMLVILMSLVFALMLLTPAGAAASITTRIASAPAKQGLAGSGTSVGVYDLTEKRCLYSLRWDVLRLPASNEKLVTSATALANWSATYRFGTQLFLQTTGPDDDGVPDRPPRHPDLQPARLRRPATSLRHDENLGASGGRRRLLRPLSHGLVMATEHDGLLRAALGAHPERGVRPQRRLRQGPVAVGGHQAHDAPEKRGHRGDALRHLWHCAGHGDARLYRELGDARAPSGGDEQAQRQLLRRGATQGARRELRRSRYDRHRGGRRQPVPEEHRRNEGLPHPRRLRTQLREQAQRPCDHQDPRRHDEAQGLQSLLELTVGRGRRWDPQGPHEGHQGGTQCAREDRHPVGGEQPFRLRHEHQPPRAGLLDPHERQRPAAGQGARRAGRDRGDPGRLHAVRACRRRFRPIAGETTVTAIPRLRHALTAGPGSTRRWTASRPASADCGLSQVMECCPALKRGLLTGTNETKPT